MKLRLLTWVLFVVVVGLQAGHYAGNAIHADHPWINHDVGYHSYLGAMMLDGKRLYVDLLEDNPPGNVLLLGGLFGLSEALRLPDFLGQHLFVLLVGIAGLAVLRSSLRESDEDGSKFLLVGLAYLIVLIRGNFSNNLFMAAPAIPYDFGQREHLFSLLFVPYLFLRLSGRAVPRPAYLFLLLSGFVSTFKPFWPVMIALVELYALTKRNGRGFSVPFTLGIGMACPLVLLLLHSPASFSVFFRENIPMYLRGGYTLYDTSYAEFAASPLHLQMVAGGIALLGGAALCCYLAAVERRELLLLLLLAGLAYLSVVHQHKFWSYHTMTFFAVCVVPAAWLWATALSRLRRPALRRGLLTAATALAVALAGVATAATSRMLREFPPLGDALVPLIEPYDKPMFFSMSVTTSYAPLLLRKPMVGPYTVFLDLPELLALPEDEERTAILAEYAERVNRVIDSERPDLLVYSPNRQAMPSGRTLHDVLVGIGVDPRRLGYQPISAEELRRTDPRLAGWIVYRRGDAGSA